MIIDQAIDFLSTSLGEKWSEISIADVRIGLYLTAVKLSDGSAGVASTVSRASISCKKEERRYGPFSPMQIRGRKLADLFSNDSVNHVSDSLRLAALNALSSHWIKNGKHTLYEDTDPVDLLELSGDKHVAIVGAFQSYIRKIMPAVNKLSILELHKNALTQDQQHLFVPASDAGKVIPQADILIVTGMTLVNNTLDDLLSHVTRRQQVVVTGPSGSIVPAVLFENKVNLIGATLVTDADKLLSLAGEAGGGYHLFHYCARKVAIKAF